MSTKRQTVFAVCFGLFLAVVVSLNDFVWDYAV